MYFSAYGRVNWRHPDYSLPSFVEEMISTLASPLETVVKNREILTNEKEVVKKEIAELHAQHSWYIDRFIYSLAFSRDNPLRITTSGKWSSIKRIAVEDIISTVEDTLIPDGLFITILIDGSTEDLRRFTNHLVPRFLAFPRKEKKRNHFYWQRIEKRNQKPKEGQILIYRTPLANKLISIFFLWILEIPIFSPLRFCLNRLGDEISHKFFLYGRDQGFSYSVGSRSMGSDTYPTVLYNVGLDVPKMPKRSLFSLIKKIRSGFPRIFQFSDEHLRSVIGLERMRHEAIPLTQKLRLDWMSVGEMRFGRFINADEIIQQYLAINLDQYRQHLDYFTSHEPIIAIVGDVGE